MPSDAIIALRKQLREKFPAAHREEQGHACPVAPTPRREAPQTNTSQPSSLRDAEPGFPPVFAPQRHGELGNLSRHHDATPDSRAAGFPSGAITEISPAEPSCGLSLIVATLLSEAPEHENTVPLVLIDARDRFDPASFTPEECARLLWLRCRDTTQALRAADLLLRDGNLPFVLLDLSALPARELRRIPNSSWHRLRQLAQSTNTTLLALTPMPLIPRTALRLTLTRQFNLSDLQLSRSELLALLQTQTTRHLHRTA